MHFYSFDAHKIFKKQGAENQYFFVIFLKKRQKNSLKNTERKHFSKNAKLFGIFW